MAKAIDLFAVSEKIHEDLPGLRFASGRWAFYAEDKTPLLFGDFIDCVKYLRHLDGFEWLSKVITDGAVARRLEELLRKECDDGQYHPWGLSNIANSSMVRFNNGGRLNEPPETFKTLKRNDFLFLNRVVFHANDNGRFWIISGAAGSGKSSLMNIAIQMLDGDFSAIENTKGSNFDMDQIVTRRIAYADDVTGDLPIPSGFLKSIVTHGNIAVDPKLRQKFTIRYPQSTIVFLSNEKPKINIGDSGILRRICWYKKTDPIKNPDWKRLTQSFSEWALSDLGLFLLSFEEWLNSDSEKHDWFEYFKDDTIEMASASSTVFRFYRSIAETERSVKFHYKGYCDYCKDAGYKAYNLGNFEDQVQTLVDWGRINKDDIGQIDLIS